MNPTVAATLGPLGEYAREFTEEVTSTIPAPRYPTTATRYLESALAPVR
jgi:hypothetical protein